MATGLTVAIRLGECGSISSSFYLVVEVLKVVAVL